MEISNRILFFKYALPCAETLIKRGTLSQEEFEKMLSRVREEKEPEKNSEDIFKVAMAHLNFIAREKEKNEIDDDTIREYFLFNHDKVVDDRFEEMHDFDPEACRTCFGIVTRIKNNTAMVETPVGMKSCRYEFAKDLEIDDIVVVHRNFVVEKISEGLADRLGESMEKYSQDLVKF